MQKHSFKNDYSEGCHPVLLHALMEHNVQQKAGYGEDFYSQEVERLIQEKCQQPSLKVHLVSGGTQANLLVIAAALRPYESVISAETGHIHVHETGAIEAIGHKIQTVSTEDGKLTPKDVQQVLDQFENEHTVMPRLVYISNTTELGTLYSLEELSRLATFCKRNNLFLFMDGARLGSALSSTSNDLDLPSIAKHCDAFYIGGTKNGALLGEAIVIVNPELQKNFRFHMKQHGALLAKGSVLGIQFMALLSDDLFFKIASHANSMALKLAHEITQLGHPLLTEAVSNQIFPILPLNAIKALENSFDFYIWKKVDDQHAAIRLVTSWATEEHVVNAFIKQLREVKF